MRLLVIGTGPRAQISVNSQYASGYHAELIQLDNGDMFIVDKNSTNGTFVNGQKIEPDKEVAITRGAKVQIADAFLDWGRVPELVVDRNAKALIGIGTHYRNKIRLSGDRASRFHATIKETKDGKWFICDHSTNGTSVNGSRLPKDSWKPLKRGDEIKCAGQVVENPIPSSGVGKVIGIVAAAIAAVAAVVALIFFLPHNYTDKQLYDKYESSMVFIKLGFHYHISCPKMEQIEPGKYKNLMNYLGDSDFTIDEDGDLIPFNNYDRSEQDKPQPIIGSATGFFITKDGKIATNLHVAKPWLYGEEKFSLEAIEVIVGRLMMDVGAGYAEYQKDLKVEGVMDFLEVIPNGRYNVEKNAIPCVTVAASSNEDIDISIIKLQQESGRLPKGCTYVNIDNCPDVKNGQHIFTLGYPLGERMQEKDEILQAASTGGDVMKVDNRSFTHNATTKGGASGSPVFNKKGQLVGIHHAHRGDAEEYRLAVKAHFIKQILEQVKPF